MDKVAPLLTWIQANWYVVIAVVLYIIANLAPRPHPESMTGWQKMFWTIVDRACVLTADAIPGNLKWLFAPSPPVVSAVTPAEGKKDEAKS